jgi:hypothetical protein
VSKTAGDIANRLGLWAAVAAIGLYVMNIGAWVGAADEKFNDAETVETKQEAMIIQQAVMATKQEAIETAVEKNAEAIEESRKEILDAIKDAHRND